MAIADHYVDNKEFFVLMEQHYKRRIAAEAKGEPPPKPSDVIGLMILKICNRMMSRWNFAKYTWRDEMEDAAIIDCTAAINKFDPNIGVSPFSYFSQVAYYAAVRIINSEIKQNDIKLKMMSNLSFYTVDEKDDKNDFSSINVDEFLENRANVQ